MKIKVLGIGSPFGEDQVGWIVAEKLKRHFNNDSVLQINCYDRPGVRLIELIENADIVFIIDAVKSGSKIGKIYRLEDERIFEHKNLLSTHGIGVVQALQLGKALGILPRNITLYGIEITSIEGFQTKISPPVNQAIKKIAMELKNELRQLLEDKKL